MKSFDGHKMGGAASAGFTIVELVGVILLLGILTATALPRFLDVTDEAHDAVVQGVLGGFNTGLALFRAAYVAQGEPTPDTPIVNFGLGTLRNNAAGYPISTTADATGVVNAPLDCVEIYNGLLQEGRPTIDAAGIAATAGGLDAANDITGSTTDFQALHSAATSTTCYYAYTGQYVDTAAATANADVIPILVYDSTTGSVTLSDSSNF
jgi:type II secretory pathway pseudopilin PulG